ncbi:hypothetical protein ACLOJK_019987 [Asimina triloba]
MAEFGCKFEGGPQHPQQDTPIVLTSETPIISPPNAHAFSPTPFTLQLSISTPTLRTLPVPPLASSNPMRPQMPKPAEKKVSWPEPDAAAEQASRNINPHPPTTTQFAVDCWFDDACILDMDYFVKTLSGVKAKGVRPDLIGSIIVHYASKWLPDLAGEAPAALRNPAAEANGTAPESAMASWLKKRFLVETIIGILPPEKESVSCNFLLRLLRMANMVGAEAAYRGELEKRVAWQLEQASLKELMIPGFSHTCGTLLDVELVARLVRRFVGGLDEGVGVRNGAALAKVAKLIDCYLAEIAVDANLSLPEFMALGGALPSHARATDDGLYRAIDTYLKVREVLHYYSILVCHPR